MIVSGNIYLKNCLESLFFRNERIYVVNLDLAFEKPIIRLDLEENFVWFKFERNDVVVINAERDLETIFEKLSQIVTFTPRSKTILIVDTIKASIFATISKFYISRVLVVEKTSKTVQNIYSYQPYKSENVNKPSLNFFKWNFCVSGILNKTKTFVTFLPLKWRNTIVQILNNFIPPYAVCPSCSTNRGIEIDTFSLISRHFQFKTNYTRTAFDYWGSKTNGSYSHILGSLQNREGEMALGVFHSKFDEHYDFDISYTFMEDGIRWLVPKAKLLPYWKRLALIFTKEVYLGILGSFLGMLLLCRFLYKINFPDSGILLYQILLECSLKVPGNHRTAILIWICCGLIISTVFKSKLIETMSKSSYEKQINTLSDIVNSKLHILIDHDIAKFFSRSNPVENHIKNSYEYCPNPRDCINRTAFVQNCVTVDFQRSNEFFLPNFLNSEGDVLVYLFENVIFPVHIQMFFVKGYPVFEQIDEFLMRLRAFGFIEHFYDGAGYNARRALSRKRHFRAEILNLEHVEIAFFMWGVGMVIASVVFGIECILNSKKQSRTQ